MRCILAAAAAEGLFRRVEGGEKFVGRRGAMGRVWDRMLSTAPVPVICWVGGCRFVRMPVGFCDGVRVVIFFPCRRETGVGVHGPQRVARIG